MTADPPASGSFPQAPAAPSLVGEILDGRYRIFKKLGEGGMGEVYAAEHVHIEKRFAVKLLKAEIVTNAEAVKRFQQEARSSSSIKHRNIIAVEDFGRLPDGRIYMCMELLDGTPLNDLIQQPMSADRLLNILIQSGHGLAAAHAKGIVHRDMKPENIFVTHEGPNDVPKLLDFGIAKVAGNDGQNNLTRTGTIFGTPFYMAPEQALGNPVDARTDIYAMGVIMYECFAGSLPFQGESFMGILTQHITADPEPVAQRAVKAGRALPMGIAEIITRCMQKNPAQRFQTMDELVNALIQVYRGIAGPGMSTYMEAFPVGSAQHTAQPTPPPMTGAHVAQASGAQTAPPSPHSATVAVGTPPPFAAGQSQPAMQQGSGPSAAVSSQSGLYDPAGSSLVTPPKSRVGLYVAIFVLLAAAGGITAVMLLGKDGKKDDSGGGSGSEVASNAGSGSSDSTTPDPNAGGSAGPANTGSQAGAPVGSGAHSQGSDSQGAGSDAQAGSGSDAQAGSGSDAIIGSGSDATIPPPVDTIEVGVFTVPYLDEFEIWEGGKKLQSGAEDLVVVKGSPRTIVVKAKGFKDSKPIPVDGKKKRIKVKLERAAGTAPPVIRPPAGPDCTRSVVDPKSKRCRDQFCASNPDDPRCDVE